MAVGKGSMERASKAALNTDEKAAEPKKGETMAENKTEAPKKETVKKPAASKASVITGTSEQVMGQIVYQGSSGLLEREAEPNESFYVGDDMPIYYF